MSRVMIWGIIMYTIMGTVNAQKATFENYKNFEITPSTKAQVKILKQLSMYHEGLNFWEMPFMNTTINVMVAPHKLSEFYETMDQIGARYQLNIENVQALIDQTMPANRSTSFDFISYHTLEEIYKNLEDLVEQYPNKAQIIIGGETYEGRQIKGVKISFKANNPGIFIEGGIHAREWISPATVMYILHQLLANKDSDVRALAESHDWYIFPLFNPDGYVYTYTRNRLWRKTRKRYSPTCVGVDLNRNWDYKWKRISNKRFCSINYSGDAPSSEIEIKSMSKYIKSISDKFYAYISFHSYKQVLVFPYGYTRDDVDNYDDLHAIGLKAITALKKRYGTEYLIGSIAETIYVTTGNSVDYIRNTYKKNITYCYELRDRGHYGFLLPPDQIIPTGEEVLDSLVIMFKEAKIRGYS